MNEIVRHDISNLDSDNPVKRVLRKVLNDIASGGFGSRGGAIEDKIVVIGSTIEDSFICMARTISLYEKPYYRLRMTDYMKNEDGLLRSFLLVSDLRESNEYIEYTYETDHNWEHSTHTPLPEVKQADLLRQILNSPPNRGLTEEQLDYYKAKFRSSSLPDPDWLN